MAKDSAGTARTGGGDSAGIGEGSTRKSGTAPPGGSAKPENPTDLNARAWRYTLRKTIREFVSDQCIDLAAALTYYAVLAVFPALLAMVSILGLFGEAERTTRLLLEFAGRFLAEDMVQTIQAPIQSLAASPAAGLAFVTGLVGALWSASGYVAAFSRAANRIYQVEEGRTTFVLRPMQLGVTVVAVVLLTVAAVLLVLSGPVAKAVGDFFGLGEATLLVWNIAKWPVIVLIAVFVLALLYYAGPNIRQPKFRWVSVGSFVALLVWAIATTGFGFYVANFGNYDAVYGSLGGVIVFLLWVWITNNALLFGAELDAELERARQLQAGIEAAITIQLPPRSTKASEKKREKWAEDVLRGVRLRKASKHGPSAPKG